MIKINKSPAKIVTQEILNQVYEKIKTPFKHGAVLKFNEDMCDSPVVFKLNNKWYMSFIKIGYDVENSGYDSHLATSDDLVNWKYLCSNIKRSNSDSWDCNQVAGYAAFIENDFNGEYRIEKVNGNYYFAYLGGKLKGYETDPLSVGMIKFSDIENPESYQRLDKPVLAPSDSDARFGEKLSVFKSNMFIDKAKTLGYKYVNAYNARGTEFIEKIYLAVSNDGENWERYGEEPILFDETPTQSQRILGDPQVLKMGNLYVMVYFVYDHAKNTAFNTFACSYDLVNWTKWNGENLIESQFEWENKFAHKPWIVVENGIVYHYYCAVNSKGERFIALATSKEIK